MNHKEIYDKIPSFKCIPGCTDCCTVMQEFDDWEWTRVSHKFPIGLQCPYLGKGCQIYENRPFICRLYGNSDVLQCKYGHGPVKRLTVEETYKLIEEYRNAEAE